jgi:hypothetical protein
MDQLKALWVLIKANYRLFLLGVVAGFVLAKLF